MDNPPTWHSLQSSSDCRAPANVWWPEPHLKFPTHPMSGQSCYYIVPTTSFNSTSPTPSSFNTADHNSVVQFFDNSLYFGASSREYWCSSSCWAFCRGHGSSGPRRIKGNFMEIGFIHNSTLCYSSAAEQAGEVIAQKELVVRVVVFCMAAPRITAAAIVPSSPKQGSWQDS